MGNKFMRNKFLLCVILLLSLSLVCGLLSGCMVDLSELTDAESQMIGEKDLGEKSIHIEKDGHYTTRDDVAAYIHEFGKLPSNFIKKSEAKKLGWDSSKGNLWDVAPQKSIGGDNFSNYEETLPVKSGRKYYECDINYNGGHRGAERVVFSNDGYIYYTNDHYKTFIELYTP